MFYKSHLHRNMEKQHSNYYNYIFLIYCNHYNFIKLALFKIINNVNLMKDE